MNKNIIILLVAIVTIATSCVNDGIETNENYVNSQDSLKTLGDSSSVLAKAQVHFEKGVKLALLDQDTIGDWNGAIEELNKAIGLNPKFVKAYHYKAIMHSYLKQENEAMKNVDKALDLDATHIESYFVKAALYTNNNDVENALVCLDKLIAIAPNNGKAYDRRGYLKISIGDKEEGCKDLHKARELGYLKENREADQLICN